MGQTTDLQVLWFQEREKSRSLFTLIPKPPFYTKGPQIGAFNGGLLGDWQSGVFHHFHTLCEEGYLDNCEKKVRF